MGASKRRTKKHATKSHAGTVNVFVNDPKFSVKETRKQLGKAYEIFSDEEVLDIVTLLDEVARDFVLSTATSSKIGIY